MSYQQKYIQWCNDSYFDGETKAELHTIENDDKEIKDRFYKDLEFGTGGLRGVIGAGTNRMNIYTVRKATQGLANYILNSGEKNKKVAIAYDSRIKSTEFAKETALCLNANGINTFCFETLRPTPELSFAVRELGCVAGIVITASHNPSEYNGYKVYWKDGAQITPPHDKNIMREIKAIISYEQAKTMSMDKAIELGLYKTIGKAIDDRYVQEVINQSIHKDDIKCVTKDLKIVYTPLHGTGNILVRRVLDEMGFDNVYVVKEQEMPDGKFSTVEYPNPEHPQAFELALKLAREKAADIVLATDPDADRLGVYTRDSKSGDYIALTGNMIGIIISEYVLSEKRIKDNLSTKAALVDTVVTTDMAKAVAKEYRVKLFEVLTGFKYIGEQIKLFDKNGDYDFVLGFEESYGCLLGTYARDKDACVSAMMICEIAAWCKSQGKTLWDYMIGLYEKYGYYKEGLETFIYKGVDGLNTIHRIMDKARNTDLSVMGECKVISIRDYKNGIIKNMITGEKSSTNLPNSDVIYFDLEHDAWCCVRPSGTEPKIKFYFGVKGKSLEDSELKLKVLKDDLMKNFT